MIKTIAISVLEKVIIKIT